MSESVVISKLAKRIETLTEEKRNLRNLNHRLAQSTIAYEQIAMIANQKLETLREENKQKEEYIVDLLDYITGNEQKLEAIRYNFGQINAIFNHPEYIENPPEILTKINHHRNRILEVLGDE